MKRVLVAGGAGLIGSHLSELLLDRDCEVLVIDNFLSSSRDNVLSLVKHPRFTLVEQDVLKPFSQVGDINEIYHLASPASPVFFQSLAEEIAMVNSTATWQLLDLARKNNARFLLASTSEIYGDPLEHPQKETYFGNVNTLGPRAPYDESKRFGETLTYLAATKYGVDARIVRIFNTYGPRMRFDDGRAVVDFIGRALRGESLVIFGDGSQTRSWCYVTDMARGIHKAMTYNIESAFPVNLGNPGELTVLQIAQMIIEMTNSNSTLEFAPLPAGDPVRRRPDITRARNLLGWEPQVPIEEGLAYTISWYREQSGLH